jgi:hypothetical protein
MTFGYNAQSRTDLFRRAVVKVVRIDQVWYMSVDTIVLLRDLACLLNDLSLPDSRCFCPVYLSHKFHVFQALADVSRILRAACGRQNLCRTSHDSQVIPYLVSVINYDVDGGKGRWPWK